MVKHVSRMSVTSNIFEIYIIIFMFWIEGCLLWKYIILNYQGMPDSFSALVSSFILGNVLSGLQTTGDRSQLSSPNDETSGKCAPG